MNFNIFWGFSEKKNEYFLWSSQNWTILAVISMHFRVKVQNGDIFGDAKISFFWGGMLEIPDVF